MKLMKLLLIGLLSVVALAACSEDEAATTKAAFSIVQVSDNGTPVLYDNVTVTLKALKDGAYVDTAVFTQEGVTDADVTAGTGSATVKVTDPAKGTGTITATIIITAGDATADPVVEEVKEVVTYTIAPANVAVTAIAVTPSEKVTLTGVSGSATAKKAYTVEGTVGEVKVDVTADTVITPITGFTIDDNVVSATTTVAEADITFTFPGVTPAVQKIESTVTAAPGLTLKSFTVQGPASTNDTFVKDTNYQLEVTKTMSDDSVIPATAIKAQDTFTCEIVAGADTTAAGAVIADSDLCSVTATGAGKIQVKVTTTNTEPAVKTDTVDLTVSAAR